MITAPQACLPIVESTSLALPHTEEPFPAISEFNVYLRPPILNKLEINIYMNEPPSQNPPFSILLEDRALHLFIPLTANLRRTELWHGCTNHPASNPAEAMGASESGADGYVSVHAEG